MFKFRRPIFEAGGRHRSLSFRMHDKPESKRVYTFPGGDIVEIENMVESAASRHGNHQLKTSDGMVHVVPWGWICLSFPAEAQVSPEECK